MNGKRLILAGGTGFIGTILARTASARGFDVVVLTRQVKGDDNRATPPIIRECQWDGRTVGPWAKELEGAHAVINLAGRSINCRFTPENIRELIDSRVNSVRAIGEAIRRCEQPPRVLVQVAGEGIYGDRGEAWCDEDTPPGQGFLVPISLAWEGAFQDSAMPATRRVLLRLGMVLSGEGGALKPLAMLTSLGLGGRAGSGKQFISWIHAEDVCRISLLAFDREDFEGVFNVSSPNPLPNAEFMAQLRRARHRPWAPPAPAWAVRLGARLLRTESQLALTGVRCRPKRLLERSFTFSFPELSAALSEIFHP